MHDRRGGHRSGGPHHLPNGEDGRGIKSNSDVEGAAVSLHGANRLRALHFNAPVMADTAMDIMLSLFIALEHKRPLSFTALAMANAVSPERCTRLLDELAMAQLVNRTAPHLPVTLTERGARLMREYLGGQAPLAA